MIKTKEVYDYYLHKVEKNYQDNKIKLDQLLKNQKELKKEISKFSYFLNKYSNLNIDKLDNLTSDFKLVCSINCDISNNFNSKEIEKLLDNQINLNIKVSELTKEVSNYELIPLKNQAQFNFILKEFNKLIINEVIENNYKYTLGKIGQLKIRKRKRKGKVVNWGPSNKNKAKIIKEGKLPYKEVSKDIEGNSIGNGGEAWLVYHENNIHPYFYWDREYINPEFKKHLNEGMLKNVSFTPTKGDVGIVYKLNKAIQDRPELLKIYNK